MQKILAFSGAKQSGKTTCVNFLHGYEMLRNETIAHFEINESGELLVNATFRDESGNETESMGIFDVHRSDDEFAQFASQKVWPFIKAYNFADALKAVSMNIFELTREQCYGTDDEKNTHTKIIWENLPAVWCSASKNQGPITAREFLQYFGTDICRRIKPDIWTSYCLRRIEHEESALSLIGDCRFPNEVEAVKAVGGKVIRLTRRPKEDEHSSETALDDYKDFDATIENVDMSIEEQCRELLDILGGWGWVESQMGL